MRQTCARKLCTYFMRYTVCCAASVYDVAFTRHYYTAMTRVGFIGWINDEIMALWHFCHHWSLCGWLHSDRNVFFLKNIEIHSAHTIVWWPNPKQWVIVHTSDLMMIIRQSIYIFSIITKGMGKLKTHSPTYYIMDNWDNMLNLTHTLDKLYLTGIL